MRLRHSLALCLSVRDRCHLRKVRILCLRRAGKTLPTRIQPRTQTQRLQTALQTRKLRTRQNRIRSTRRRKHSTNRTENGVQILCLPRKTGTCHPDLPRNKLPTGKMERNDGLAPTQRLAHRRTHRRIKTTKPSMEKTARPRKSTSIFRPRRLRTDFLPT